MPIKPENKGLYPENWSEIRLAILERADHRCENCGVPDRARGYRDQGGLFHLLPKWPLRDAGFSKPPFRVACLDGRTLKVIEVVLTIAHLDHQPENNDDMEIFGKNIPKWAVPAADRSNLRAWCQRCHLIYDSEHHSASAVITKRRQLEEAGQLRLNNVA